MTGLELLNACGGGEDKPPAASLVVCQAHLLAFARGMGYGFRRS